MKLTAEEYISKNMMAPSTFKLFMRARKVIASCTTHFQLISALQYNSLAKKKAGLDWCIDSFISKKQKQLNAS